jgi:hypothetical protein
MRSFVDTVEQALPTKRFDVFGKGRMLMTSSPYFIMPLIFLLATQIIWTHSWILIIILYALLPLLDEVFSLDLANPNESQRR